MIERLLIVEDDVVFCKLISKFLLKNDLVTADVQSIEAAKHWLSTTRPDVLLVDYRLPDGNGIELVNWLYNTFDDAKKVQVVMMSRYDEGEIRQREDVSNVRLFLKKPLSPDILLDVIQRLNLSY